jgi:hypothetical protein
MNKPTSFWKRDISFKLLSIVFSKVAAVGKSVRGLCEEDRVWLCEIGLLLVWQGMLVWDLMSVFGRARGFLELVKGFWELVREICKFAWGFVLKIFGKLRKFFKEKDGVLRFSWCFPIDEVSVMTEKAFNLRDMRYLEGFRASGLAKQDGCLWPILPHSVQ